MRKLIVLPVLGVAAALAVAVGCGSAGTSPPSVAGFVSLATAGVHQDFEPLASPKDAVDKGDLIVEGTLAEVVDGVKLQYPNPTFTERQAGTYVTLVVSVTKVIDGDAGTRSGDRVYVELAKSSAVTAAQLSAANSRPKIVAVLDDITTWVPAPDVTVTRPAAVPDDAALYAPYTDGMWLQAAGDTEMHGLGAHREKLSPAWGGPLNVDQFSAALLGAAGR